MEYNINNMVIKNETRWYVTLSIICLVFIIILSIFSPGGNFKHDIAGLNTKVSFNRNNINLQDIPIFAFIFLFYAGLFIFGAVNLFLLIKGNLNKRYISSTDKIQRRFMLSNKNASMLIFGIIYIYLAVYLTSIVLTPERNADINHILWIFTVLSYTFYLFVVISVLKTIPISSMGVSLSKNHFVYSVKAYFATAVIIFITTLMLAGIQKIFNVSFNPQPMVYLIAVLRNKFFLVMLILEIVILAPISEELIFRGIIYNYLRNKIRWEYAALLTSFIFALLHANIFGFFIIFIVSMAICYVYEKSNNILTAFLFHSLHNTLSIANILVLKHFFLS